MSKLIAFIGVTLVLGVVAADAQAPPNAIARFYEFETGHTSLGNFRGATESWQGSITVIRTRKAIGASYVSCIRMSEETRNCYANYALPRGTMVAVGLVGSRSRYSLTITGGTGAYLTYHGWVSVNSIRIAQQQVGPDGRNSPPTISQIVFHLHKLSDR